MNALRLDKKGKVVKFNAGYIVDLIAKAGEKTGEFDCGVAKTMCIRVLNLLEMIFENKILSDGEIQDVIEEVLLSSPYCVFR